MGSVTKSASNKRDVRDDDDGVGCRGMGVDCRLRYLHSDSCVVQSYLATPNGPSDSGEPFWPIESRSLTQEFSIMSVARVCVAPG